MRFRAVLLLALLLPGGPAALRAQEAPAAVPDAGETAPLGELTPDQKKEVIDHHYARAFQYYGAGQYGRAIEHWNLVLRMDPAQQTARRLIEEARPKLAAQNNAKLTKLKGEVDGGDYRTAYETLQLLLDADPQNAGYRDLEARLLRVSRLLPQAPGGAKGWRALRTGLSAWLGAGRPPEPRRAFNGLRYAAELLPGNAKVEALVAAFEAEHSDLAESDKAAPGMPFLDFKRLTALNQIYDGKYHLAIRLCEDVLELEPEDLTTLKRLGSAHYALGRKDEARAVWSRAQRLAPRDKQLQRYLSQKE